MFYKFFLLSHLIFFLLCNFSFAQKIRQISFSEGLKKVLAENASILQSQAALLDFQAIKEKADSSDLPTINILGFLAPTFEVKGDPIKVKRNYNKWGPALLGQMEIIWPIFNFGRTSLAKKAAQQGLDAVRELHKSKINQIIFEYKKIYLSLILLKNYKKILDEAEEQSKKILEKAQEIYALGEGKILKKDLARLKIYNMEIKKLRIDLDANQKNGRIALGHYLGQKESVGVISEEFPKIEEEIPNLTTLIKLSFEKKPEWKALKMGFKARKNYLKVEKMGLVPVFFIGFRGTAAYTPIRENQDSTFANDPYNQLSAEGAIGVRWKFDWSNYSSKVTKAESELKKLNAQKKEAETGFPLRISQAFWGIEKAEKKWSISQKKLKEATQWSLSELNAYFTGIGKPKDLVESLSAYYLAQREEVEAEYNYLFSWAKLVLEIGDYAMLTRW